jgi:hypothetical protein
VQRLYGHPSERLARERIKRATATTSWQSAIFMIPRLDTTLPHP